MKNWGSPTAMKIIFFHPESDAGQWINGLEQRLPTARVRAWQPADRQPADYALVWHPPTAMLTGRDELRGVFILGAGVDALLNQLRQHPRMLPAGVPLLRLEDTGMAAQMIEYVVFAVLGYYRRFDEYRLLQARRQWRELSLADKQDFTIGVAGAGVLGQQVAQALVTLGFPVRCWSLSPKAIPQVTSFAGEQQLADFLSGTRLLVNLLPNTSATRGILDASLFRQLVRGAYIINVGRGAHLNQPDLLAAIDSGQIAAATLDVCAEEPLPAADALWHAPRVTLTPHIAAATLPALAMDNIAENIRRIENGLPPFGKVDRVKGY